VIDTGHASQVVLEDSDMSLQLNYLSPEESGAAPVGGFTARRWVRGSLPAWKERRIKELMRSELSNKLSLRRLATECDLSVRHFTRAFAQSTGLTPHRYLLRLRLDKARELLLDPALRLHEIAMTCGFADQSHFTRVFSASEKVSPGIWRRLNLAVGTPGAGQAAAPARS
jgi:AraC family transcriptional regulator